MLYHIQPSGDSLNRVPDNIKEDMGKAVNSQQGIEAPHETSEMGKAVNDQQTIESSQTSNRRMGKVVNS